mgnify:CR=1 FL=1
MRLIDADEAIINFGFEWDDIPPTIEEFVRFLKKQPTVDAVEVVRCKYCAVPHNKYTGCPELNGLVTPPDFFCPFGEQKKGE